MTPLAMASRNKRVLVVLLVLGTAFGVFYYNNRPLKIQWNEEIAGRIESKDLRIQIIQGTNDLDQLRGLSALVKEGIANRVMKEGFEHHFFILSENGRLERAFLGRYHRIYAVVRPQPGSSNNLTLAMIKGRANRTVMLLNSNMTTPASDD
jgi:hypothetical protein